MVCPASSFWAGPLFSTTETHKLTSNLAVQFLLLMSQYLQGTESSVQTWNVHGLAVKASYQLGLHSQHALERYDSLEREMRIRTWYGCVLLDRYVRPVAPAITLEPTNDPRLVH